MQLFLNLHLIDLFAVFVDILDFFKILEQFVEDHAELFQAHITT